MSSLTCLLLLLALIALSTASPFVLRAVDDAEPSEEPEPSPEDDDVCVSEKYLRDLGHTDQDFVHVGGKVSRVLCPGNGLPCGTRFHRVRIDGVSKSYEEICEMWSCEAKIEKVNSVWSHEWEEKMVEKNVVLTMYDHRYVEGGQKMLHWAMKNVRGLGL